MRVLLTTALIIWPSFALAQIGDRTTKKDDLVSSSRLGKLAKKISNENAAAADPQPSQIQSSGQTQGQGLGQTGLQNYSLSTATTNPSPSLSSKGLGSGAYDLSSGQNASLDVAGVRIGMSPDQVKRTLTAKGYRLEATKNHASFEELVKATREDISQYDQRSFKGAIGTLEFKNGIFEEISVTFMSMPGHPIANRVAYENRDSSLTEDKVRHLLLDKYGSDINRKFTRDKIARLPTSSIGNSRNILRDREQQRLDTQRNFHWINKKNPDQNTQHLKGKIIWLSKREEVFTLTLNGESNLGTLQQEQIRSRLGASTTTF